ADIKCSFRAEYFSSGLRMSITRNVDAFLHGFLEHLEDELACSCSERYFFLVDGTLDSIAHLLRVRESCEALFAYHVSAFKILGLPCGEVEWLSALLARK